NEFQYQTSRPGSFCDKTPQMPASARGFDIGAAHACPLGRHGRKGFQLACPVNEHLPQLVVAAIADGAALDACLHLLPGHQCQDRLLAEGSCPGLLLLAAAGATASSHAIARDTGNVDDPGS